MLKNIMLISLLLLISSAGAFAQSYDINHIIVHIRNVGAENCTMGSVKIFQGEMVGGEIPKILAATGENYGFVLQGNAIDTSISYKCGKYKVFTINMKKYFSKHATRAAISASFSDVLNVFEKHTVEPGYRTCAAGLERLSACSSVPSRINWEISN